MTFLDSFHVALVISLRLAQTEFAPGSVMSSIFNIALRLCSVPEAEWAQEDADLSSILMSRSLEDSSTLTSVKQKFWGILASVHCASVLRS